MKHFNLSILALFLLFSGAALSQTPIAPGGACDGIASTTSPRYKEVKKGDTVVLCFDKLPSVSGVDYLRVRTSQQPAGTYNQWFRLSPTAVGFSFIADKTRHIVITTVQTSLGWESPFSNAVLIKLVP
jgi:hypothetical protein